MNNIISIIVLAAVLFSVNACNRTNNKQNNQSEKPEKAVNYLSVDDVFTQGESLSGKTVHVEGIIEHVCKHTWKRFKMIGDHEIQFIKIELGDKLPTVDASIIGNTAKVTGKLIPVKMDASKVKGWEMKMKNNHKGEENTDHYKEEIGKIQLIYSKIVSGEIPYYINYYIQAENYEIE